MKGDDIMALAYTTGKRPGRHPIGFTEEQGERNHFTDDFWISFSIRIQD